MAGIVSYPQVVEEALREFGDVLAAGAFGPGLPEPTSSWRAGSPGPAPVTYRANSRSVNRRLAYRLPAGSTPQSSTALALPP
jgi:hypothetical protein